MAQIQILDSDTIDKIAAGEVVERPSSVVKELVENAIDAGAAAITVEAKDGGATFIRVTDNGCGMEKEQLRRAFLRHATSKIRTAEDLQHVASLGFRGEALSSIAAVSKVEVITKTADSLTGSRIVLEGAGEVSFEEIGAPDGTTFIMRNLFYNTPVRRKFLKTAATEGGYIADLMEHLALSRPDISFKFVLGNQTKFHTSGNGDLKEVIYRIYGRETAAALTPIQWEQEGIRIDGYLGKPALARANRSLEIYFINGRFIRSGIMSKAIEEGYKEYLMQHKFPFCVLHISMDPERVDVNVHPTKMDVRFSNGQEVCSLVAGAVKAALERREMIPEVSPASEKEIRAQAREIEKEESRLHNQLQKEKTPEPFEQKRTSAYKVMEESVYRESPVPQEKREFLQNPVWTRVTGGVKEQTESQMRLPNTEEDFFVEAEETGEEALQREKDSESSPEYSAENAPEQLNLFEERILTMENRARYRMLGQVFDTYWLIQFEDKLLMVDQHAAHEKVKYERLMKQYHEKNIVSQRLMPPIIVSLTGQEEVVLQENREAFFLLGFEIESFGGNEYALRSVPVDLYGGGEREIFLEVLNELAGGAVRGPIKTVEEKIASMSCKAAVKGNNSLSTAEASALIDELLTLDNPYNCPHGRPTIISMSKSELEKKFKR